MQKREGAIKFKDKMLALIGPELKAGDAAPEFTCATGPFDTVSLKDTPAKARLFSVVPSLDTPVCEQQTKKFSDSVGAMGDVVATYTVSVDMPFAQKRFCAAHNIENIVNLADIHDHSFGKNYGVLLEGLAFPLLTRAIFVVGKDNKIAYVEYVPEVGQHPNYDAALEALKAASA
ncbi:MAG: thiol peroxidase [Gemmataceae bacterium]